MKLFGLFLSLTLLFLSLFLSLADVPELSREPPRPIVFVPHDRSKSDPQQVLWFFFSTALSYHFQFLVFLNRKLFFVGFLWNVRYIVHNNGQCMYLYSGRLIPLTSYVMFFNQLHIHLIYMHNLVLLWYKRIII